ncbi:formimidoylglutamase [Flavobacteriaceae bacterium]|nr:formimidoylglutamase [Flavobacteriaceae bacterium]MDB4014498.1 formimidoylglutamase [Flavobacteriaceae bacterium]
MINGYLCPLSEDLIEFKSNLSRGTLGSNITLYNSEKTDYSSIDIAIVGLNEYRNSDEISDESLNLENFRREFYSLFYGNWSANILDLGDVISGKSYSDTYYAVNSIHQDLINQNIVVIFIGGGQDFTFPLYQSLSKKLNKVNISSVDNKFDFGKIKKQFSSSSYMSEIIMDKKNSLNHFCNLGYQTFLNSQEEIDLLNKFNFESHRLGEITEDIKIVEPVLRETNLLTVDFKSIKSSELNFVHNYSNGFESSQFCSVLRYAGMSNSINSVGLFELLDSSISSALLSQSIWYFIEGYCLRIKEDPNSSNFKGYTYNVFCEGTNLKFYNSELSQKWWVEFINEIETKNISLLLPCNKRDYLMACDGTFSDRLIMFLKRELI